MFRRLITKLLACLGKPKENILNSSKSHDVETNVATCYEMGVGTIQDVSEAYCWYGKAAELGDTLAARKLESLK